MSTEGLRIQRPLGGSRSRTLQLEFEIPEFDEIVWATGVVCFDQVWRLPPTPDGGLSGVIRTSGIKLLHAAERHKRMLREYVMETVRRIEFPFADEMMSAACYR